MAQTTIPSFASKYFHSLDKTEKDEFAVRLASWKANPLTEELLAFIEAEVEKSIIEEEAEDYSSSFELKFSIARGRGKRAALRQTAKQLR